MEDIRNIFKAAEIMSALHHYEDRLRKKAKQIKSVLAKRCGNCDHWMKTSLCPSEQGPMKGGPSMGTTACDKFVLDPSMEQLAYRFRDEFEAIRKDAPKSQKRESEE